MKNIFSPIADKAISIITEHGFNAFLVGGFIRQSILGEGTSDIDICTDALPSDIISVFSSNRIIETGIKHGTVTVILDDTPIEITTFRIDGDYIKNRKPESVSFTTSLTEDLRRRDFTMNAIAYNAYSGICDPFDGIGDINKRLIRCVGDAHKRFTEDALRILRALRFSAVLGFKIEEKTKKAILNNYRLLSNISGERITAEILKLLQGKYLHITLKEFNEVFTFLFENENLYEDIKTDSDHVVMLARCKSLSRLTLPSKTLKTIDVIKKASIYDKKSLLDFLATNGDNHTCLALKFLKRDDLLPIYDEFINKNLCRSISSLNVNGSDLIKEGYSGKDVGKALSLALSEVMQGRIHNKKKDILTFLKNF